MKIIRATAVALLVLSCAPGWAAAPRLHTTKTITIDASAGKVWSAVKDFDRLNTWHPAVVKDEIVEGKADRVGAVRLLTLKDGGTIKEKLLAHDSAKRTFKYSVLEGVLPVSGYTSTFSVKSTGKNKSSATWSGSYKRKNTAENPGAKEDDKTATDTVTAVYQAGLDNLKKLVEAK